jgi:hypothetical protein
MDSVCDVVCAVLSKLTRYWLLVKSLLFKRLLDNSGFHAPGDRPNPSSIPQPLLKRGALNESTRVYWLWGGNSL